MIKSLANQGDCIGQAYEQTISTIDTDIHPLVDGMHVVACLPELNVCPHELAPVCLGRVGGTTLPSAPGEFRWGREGEILACPWHGWEFDLLTGKALADKRHLRRYPVSVEDDTICVTI